MVLRVGYFRVSKEDETIQDLDSQIEQVKAKYELGDDITIYKERGSAWDLRKIKKRTEFFKMIEALFYSTNTTVRDLFIGNCPSNDVELYVWDYNRIIRNFELNLLFLMLSDFFKLKIYSYKQGYIVRDDDAKPVEKFSRYILLAASAMASENYSHNISENVKGKVRSKRGITTSYKGNKWGSKFRDCEGNSVDMSIDDIKKMNYFIVSLLKTDLYYSAIIMKVISRFKVQISKSYITKIKNAMN